VIAGILLSAVTKSQAELHRYEFNITQEVLNPDCHEFGYNVPLINGQFPGPTIRVNKGDEVEILVRNGLVGHDTSIHYHGIRQIGTVEADGVPGITQNPISPGNAFIHKFKVENQAGTYFYHAHVGLQDDSVKGAFIVYESEEANPSNCAKKAEEDGTDVVLKAGPYSYKKDLILQLSEWWHDELRSRENYYLSKSFVFDHGADSILMNGRTVFDPERKDLSAANCQGYTTFDVEPNTTYRLRIIGSTTFRTLALAIKDHNMTLIEVDGELTKPYDISFLEISPGQRYSVLLRTGDYPPGETFAIGTSYLWRQRGNGITENGFGYIRYKAPAKDTHDDDDDGDDDDDDDIDVHVDVKTDLGESTHLLKMFHKADTSNSLVKSQKRVHGFSKRAEWVRGHGKAPVQDTHSKAVTAKADVSDKTAPKNEAEVNPSVDAGKGAGGGHGDRGGHEGKGKGGAGRGGESKDVAGPRGGGRGGGNRPGNKNRVYADLPTFPNVDEPDWFYHNIEPLAPRNPIVDQVDVRTIKLNSSYRKLADNTTRYMVNQRIAPMRSTPALFQYNTIPKKERIQMAALNKHQEYNTILDTYPIKYNEILDLVFQNTLSPVGGCLLHPWHTHGHSHYLIASGPGDYDHERDKNIKNFKNPLYRDTSIAYPYLPDEGDTTKGCGWTKVRILAVS
jgi:FtsP/CotA-like multicopper oxidase with cupredoxin domain